MTDWWHLLRDERRWAFPPLPEDELSEVLALLDDVERGLAAMPEVSAIDPAVRFSAAGAPREEGAGR